VAAVAHSHTGVIAPSLHIQYFAALGAILSVIRDVLLVAVPVVPRMNPEDIHAAAVVVAMVQVMVPFVANMAPEPLHPHRAEVGGRAPPSTVSFFALQERAK